MNRHQRRALTSIVRRLDRAIKRVKAMSNIGFRGPEGESARIHVASLWTRYAQVTGDTKVL